MSIFLPADPPGAPGVKRLALGITDNVPFTLEEREAIIAGIRRYAPLYVNYVICGFWTGWRPNEACALKWHRVDFQNKKILIREGRVLRQPGIPKSTGSIRDLDRLPPVHEALVAQKALSRLLGDFGSPNGNRTRVSAVRGQYPRPLDDGTVE